MAIALFWYAVYAQHRWERPVAEELTAIQGLEVYFPQVEIIKGVYRGKQNRVWVPLFPQYLFTRFCDSSSMRAEIRRCRGVLRILGGVRKLEIVPDEEITAIRRVVSSRVAYFEHPYIQEGEVVRVRRGPLAGLRGILVRVLTETRVIISVTAVRGSVAIQVDADNVDLVKTT